MSVTDHTRGEMFASESDDGLLVLLTLTHPELDPPIRVVNDHEDLTSRGNSFVGLQFRISLPGVDTQSPLRARLTIDGVSQQIMEQARRITSDPPRVLIEVVRLSDPEVVEMSYPNMQLQNVRPDGLRVSGDLIFADLATQSFTYINFTPGIFPGLFADL